MKKKAHVLAQLQAKLALVRAHSREAMGAIHLLDASAEEAHPPAVAEAHNAHDARFDRSGNCGRNTQRAHGELSPYRLANYRVTFR